MNNRFTRVKQDTEINCIFNLNIYFPVNILLFHNSVLFNKHTLFLMVALVKTV